MALRTRRQLCLGFGARTGARRAAHRIDRLKVERGGALEQAHVPLYLTLNGQQYSAATPFGYNGALNVSRVAPALGPAAGGTRLRVHGYSFEGGVASEYACRFGSAELGWQQVP